MFNEFLIIYVFILFFGFFFMLQDIESRKVSNKLTFSFFVISFLYFLYSLTKLSWIDFILLPIFVLIIFFIYKKEVWGAADGKILISIMLILTAYGTIELFLNYILNLVVFYGIGIILVLLFYTTNIEKKNIIKKIDFVELLFILLFVYILVHHLIEYYPKENHPGYQLLFIIILITIMKFVYKYLKQFYQLLEDDLRVLVMFSLFCFSFYFYFMTFIYYFTILFIIKVIFDYFSKSIEFIADEKKYQSPFTVYIIIATIFTLFATKNIIQIIVILI